jgi:hypothetical protein
MLTIAVGASLSSAADGVAAVTTPGVGRLTVCRNWLVYNSCATYGKVALPQHIAVGDKINLTYGSNPKDYTFRVLLIRQQAATCTILNDASEGAVGGERIEVNSCRASVNPATNSR